MGEVIWSDLLRAFDPDPREAARRLQALIDKLVRIFEWRGCHQPDEAAFEVVNRVAEKIRQGVELTTTVERYASGFIHPIAHEFLRRAKREQEMIEELPHASRLSTGAEEKEAHLVCLDLCLDEKTSAEERDLLLTFHAHDGSERIKTRRHLAESKGKTVNALRIEAHRLRKRLRECVETCLETS